MCECTPHTRTGVVAALIAPDAGPVMGESEAEREAEMRVSRDEVVFIPRQSSMRKCRCESMSATRGARGESGTYLSLNRRSNASLPCRMRGFERAEDRGTRGHRSAADCRGQNGTVQQREWNKLCQDGSARIVSTSGTSSSGSPTS